jgi:phosphatidylglycerol:prolipoprotein diacylglycerol transferase
MWQEVFRIPFLDRPVYGYGLMLVIGFLAATQLAKFLAARYRLDGELFVNAALLALLFGVLGARLSHVVESLIAGSGEFANNGKPFSENLMAMLNLSSGGLTFYGGFLLATPVLIGYAVWKKVPLLLGMDIVAPCLMVGLAFGRIGCFMNGCCYGEECKLPWGADFPYGSNAFVEQYEHGEIDVPAQLTDPKHPYASGLPRLLSKEEIRKNPELTALANTLRARPVHPTEIYSAFNAFFIAAVCLAYLSLQPSPGRVFALMLILKGISRFTLEMIRVEPPVIGNLSFSMVVSLGLVTAGVLMWLLCGRLDRRPGRDDARRGFVPVPAT